MATVNASLNPKATATVLAGFQRQQEIMAMNEEMMDEAMADAFDDEEVRHVAVDTSR
jgi:hypothetical protein